MKPVLLIVAVLGTAALKLPPARTRAHALACKALLQKDSTKEDSADQVAPVPLKSSRRGPVGMLLEPGYIPGSVTIVGNSRIVGDLPGWLLPIASAACYSLPLLILYLSGDMDRDTYRRARSGGTLKRRAISDFVRGLQRIGLLPEQRPPVASALGQRSNLPAITMMAVDEHDDDTELDQPTWAQSLLEQRACIQVEGREVCGPVRYEESQTCVHDGETWVCE